MPDKVPNMVLMMPQKKRKVGRPPKLGGEKLNNFVQVCLTDAHASKLTQFQRQRRYSLRADAAREIIRLGLIAAGLLADDDSGPVPHG